MILGLSSVYMQDEEKKKEISICMCTEQRLCSINVRFYCIVRQVVHAKIYTDIRVQKMHGMQCHGKYVKSLPSHAAGPVGSCSACGLCIVYTPKRCVLLLCNVLNYS